MGSRTIVNIHTISLWFGSHNFCCWHIILRDLIFERGCSFVLNSEISSPNLEFNVGEEGVSHKISIDNFASCRDLSLVRTKDLERIQVIALVACAILDVQRL